VDLQGRAAAALATLAVLMHAIRRQLDARTVRTPGSILRHARMLDSTSDLLAVTCTTGCEAEGSGKPELNPVANPLEDTDRW
jgi:hypothetical protein